MKNTNKIKSIGKMIRRICILDHPIPKIDKNYNSSIIIIPSDQINKRNDILIKILNWKAGICKLGYYITFISTIIETDCPGEELTPAMDKIGPFSEIFDEISDIYEPIDKNFEGNIYINSSYDFSYNFENDINDVLKIYGKITGENYLIK